MDFHLCFDRYRISATYHYHYNATITITIYLQLLRNMFAYVEVKRKKPTNTNKMFVGWWNLFFFLFLFMLAQITTINDLKKKSVLRRKKGITIGKKKKNHIIHSA